MSNYQELNQFLSENMNSIIISIEEEANETKNFILKKYAAIMQNALVSAKQSENGSTLEETAHTAYFKLFNLITDIISEMEHEPETFIGEDYILLLKNLQTDAEELYLQQED